MPLYEYQCPQCGRFELIQKFSDAPLGSCPTCGQEVQKLLSAPAIQFKGSGWYITDYARKPAGGDGAKGEGVAKGEQGKAEGVAKGAGKGESGSEKTAAAVTKSESSPSKSDSSSKSGSASNSGTSKS